MNPTRTELLRAMEETYPTLVRLVSGRDDAALDYRPAEGDWSAREILAHLVDDEMYVMRLRVERIVKEDLPHLAPHDEQKWYRGRNTTRDGLSELLADFELQRRASLGMIRMLRESDWQRKGYQPEYGEQTAEEWLAIWLRHDQDHLRQIEANLEGVGSRE